MVITVCGSEQEGLTVLYVTDNNFNLSHPVLLFFEEHPLDHFEVHAYIS